jgi:hypothetical protein
MALRSILQKQYNYAKAQGWLPHFADAAAKHGFTTADLMAIASRETNMRNIKGDYHDGQYHGYSLMQLDIRSHRAWIESGAWADAKQAIFKGAAALAEKRDQIINTSKQRTSRIRFSSGTVKHFTTLPLTNAALRHCTLAAYNCGGASYYHYSVGHDIDLGTTGKDYGADVIQRAAIFQEFLKADNVAPSKPVTPSPSETKPALDQVPSPVTPSDDEKLSFADVSNKVSSATLKSILLKAGAKVTGPIVAIWQAGVHGKVLLIIAGVVVAGVTVYEVKKHWPRLKAFAIKRVKGQ